MRARLLYRSPNLNSYVNVIVAMCNKYEGLKEICITSMDNESISKNFIDDLQKELISYHNSKLYKKAARIHLSTGNIISIDIKSYKGWDIIDISAISKEKAIDIIALNLENLKVKVCMITYPKQMKGEKWILTLGNHIYINLLSEGSLSKLYKNYFQKKVIIRMFWLIFGLLTLLSIMKFSIPNFFIPEDIISVFSLIIGAGGLYLAGVSLEEK